jgi:hypothetical protein
VKLYRIALAAVFFFASALAVSAQGKLSPPVAALAAMMVGSA